MAPAAGCDLEAASEAESKISSLMNRLRSDAGVQQSTSLTSYQIATETVTLLQSIVAEAKWSNAAELLTLIRRCGIRLMSAQPSEMVVGNMIRRVLKVVKDEEERISGGPTTVGVVADTGGGRLGRSGMDLGLTPARGEASSESNLRGDIVEALDELLSELETSIENITAQSLEHIHSDEVILTAGHSRTVEKFLKQAGKKRSIKVIVAEGAPHFQGHKMAASLSEDKIDVTLITDSAVFAIMSRVNKVILGTHSILADGGLQSIAGSHMIAVSASHHSVPLIVVSAMYKLSPQFFRSADHDTFNQFFSPEKVFPQANSGALISPSLDIPCPLFDYVPPDLVTLFVSNIGGHAPSYVYRLLSDLYHQEDYDLE